MNLTNHLDFETIQALIEAIRDFQGGVLIVVVNVVFDAVDLYTNLLVFRAAVTTSTC